ncbi:hypothetical protein DFH94DRAFT_635373 [Russula ochroleuca]|jgi:hypothetical protein|uniref:Uncharacterized protein n=1 Tax=Russula ochroleuca TaxID=152965 RepID=A0A9P5MRN2_9AGAM|nr:hypothetical protein DFH94DRAFT_635373 [Russula ochroleuca]
MLALTAAILRDPRHNEPPVSDQKKATLHFYSQLNDQRDLLVDGYIAHMFGPLDAEAYYVTLLKMETRHIQWHIDLTGAFLAAPPPEPATDRHDWVIDYAIRSAGPVIPQNIWVPKRSSDKVRRRDHERLHPPIFFIHKSGRDLGLPLFEAAQGNCISLRGAEEAAFVTTSAHAQIRTNVSSISTFIARI